MRRTLWLAILLVLSALAPAAAIPSAPQFAPSYFDTDGDGLDDRLAPMVARGEAVDIFVEFTVAPGAEHFAALAAQGLSPDYVSHYIPVVQLDAVPAGKVPALTALPDLKLVHWQDIYYPALDKSVGTIKVRQNDEYSPVVWDSGLTGDGINIAILDTGVDNEHETFEGRFIAGVDCVGGCGTYTTEEGSGGDPDDRHGHGTHTASTALGTGGETDDDDNGEPDYMGVAPGARLIDVKVMTDLGAGGNILQGVDWCTNHADEDWDGSSNDGIQVMSMSVGTSGGSDGSDPISQAVNAAVANGIVAVSAMGNAGDEETPAPAAADWGIAVAWMNDQDTFDRTDDERNSDSNYGPRTDDNDGVRWDELKPDVIAPGNNIRAAAGAPAPFTVATNGYTPMSGTSMACPHVAGLAALLLEDDPSLGPEPGSNPMLWRLRNFSQQWGAASEPENSTRYNYFTGWGYVDGYSSLSADRPDGVIAALSFDPAEPLEGDTVEVMVEVANEGDAELEQGTLRLRADMVLVAERSVSSIAPGGSVTRLIDWEPAEGDYTLRAELVAVTPGESDSGNNDRELAVSVGPAPTGVDLAVIAIGLDPAAPVHNESVRVNATVRNSGDDTATHFEIRYYDDGEHFKTWRTDTNLAPGESYTFPYYHWHGEEGNHTLSARLFDIEPEDGNANNDEYDIEVEVATLPDEPDFTVESIFIEGVLEADEKLLFDVILRNLGKTDGTVDIEVRLDGEPYKIYYDQDIVSAGTAGYVFSWTATLGEHTLAVSLSNADPEEASTDNNDLSQTFVVTDPQPHFVPLSMQVTPAAPLQGASVTVSVTVANDGDANGTAIVVLTAVGTQVDTVERNIAAGAQEVIDFVWVPAVSGNVPLRVTVGDERLDRTVPVAPPDPVELVISPTEQVLTDDAPVDFAVSVTNQLTESQSLHFDFTLLYGCDIGWTHEPALDLGVGDGWDGTLRMSASSLCPLGTSEIELRLYRGSELLETVTLTLHYAMKPSQATLTLKQHGEEQFQLYLYNPLAEPETFLLEASASNAAVEVNLNGQSQLQIPDLDNGDSTLVRVEVVLTEALPAGNQTIQFTFTGTESGTVVTATVTLYIVPPAEDEDDGLLPGPGLVLATLALLAVAFRRR